MLAVVKTPRTNLEISGEIPVTILKVLRTEFGKKLHVTPSKSSDDLESVFDSSSYKEFKNRVTVGDYVHTYRKNMGFTQSQLGEQIGKSRAYICDVEHNRRSLSKETAKKLAQIFKVSASKFI